MAFARVLAPPRSGVLLAVAGCATVRSVVAVFGVHVRELVAGCVVPFVTALHPSRRCLSPFRWDNRLPPFRWGLRHGGELRQGGSAQLAISSVGNVDTR